MFHTRAVGNDSVATTDLSSLKEEVASGIKLHIDRYYQTVSSSNATATVAVYDMNGKVNAAYRYAVETPGNSDRVVLAVIPCWSGSATVSSLNWEYGMTFDYIWRYISSQKRLEIFIPKSAWDAGIHYDSYVVVWAEGNNVSNWHNI